MRNCIISFIYSNNQDQFKMQYYLAFILLTISYLFIHVQSTENGTVAVVVVAENATVIVQTTSHPTTGNVTVVGTTVSSHMNSTTNVAQKAIVASYVEPPPHPLGYCIRSRLGCSKIRRCCKGPCDILRKKCP